MVEQEAGEVLGREYATRRSFKKMCVTVVSPKMDHLLVFPVLFLNQGKLGSLVSFERH